MRKTIVILVIFPFLFVACAKKVVKPVDNPGALYVQGVDQLKKKKYENAIADFSKIRENFPFDPIAAVAQVKQGDAYFAKKEYQMAANTYEDFVNSYPDDENAAYALKRAAESYEMQSPAIDRDQAITVKAVERFTFLKNRFPASPYAADAESHLKVLSRKLAARELYVGEFYHKAAKYNASTLRLEFFLRAYPEANERDKALYLLARDYSELDRPEKAQEYRERLIREYPKSRYIPALPKARNVVRTLASATTPVATPVQAAAPRSIAAAPKAAAVSPPAAAPQPVVATPAVFNYEDKKKRDIDLRPPQAAPPSSGKEGALDKKGAKPKEEAQTPGVAVASADQGTDAAENKTVTAARPEAVVANAEKKEAVRKPEPEKSGPEKAASENPAGEAPGEKKKGIGFFTEKKPVDVVADTMEAFEKGKTIVFKGNVIAKQEGSEPGQTLFLFCDTLTAYRTDEESDIQKAEAEGNVKVVKAQRTATCKKAFFYNDKGEVILQGDVVVFEGNDRLTGDTATYYLNEDRVYVQGDKDKRARVIVTPKK